MSNDTIDIKGIDKVILFKNLWQNQVVAGFFTNMPYLAPKFNEAEAQEAVLEYIDYFCGRAIKCDLSGDTAHPKMYDLYAGAGAFQRVVNSLR
jgi:hypothetical protein